MSTQPWGAPPPPLPRRKINWLRGVGITALAAVGWFLGSMTGSAVGYLVLGSEGAGVVLMLTGMWLGLCAGLVFGFWLTKPRPASPARVHGLERMGRFQR